MRIILMLNLRKVVNKNNFIFGKNRIRMLFKETGSGSKWTGSGSKMDRIRVKNGPDPDQKWTGSATLITFK